MDLFIMWYFIENYKGKRSKYHLYFESLPDLFSIPFCYPGDWLSILPLQARIDLKLERASFFERFEKLERIMMRSKCNTFHSFNLHAFNTVISIFKTRMVRGNQIEYNEYMYQIPWLELDTVHDKSLIVPYFDMLNHSEEANALYYYEYKTDSMVVEASNDIYIGEQIFINYGCRTDDFLLQSYGFCLPPGHNALTNVRISLIEFSTALLDTMQLSVKEYFEKIVKVL